MERPINEALFIDPVVDWAIVTDWNLAFYDKGIVNRVERWCRLAVSLHQATHIIAMRDDLNHRSIYVATRKAA